jgi:hypothetical protein
VSLDIFLQCFRNGEPAAFKVAVVERIFSHDGVDFHLPLTGVRFRNGGRADIYGADGGDDTNHVMFTHFSGKTFFDALYALARETKSVVLMITPAHPIAVADQETIDHLPPGFAEGLSMPVIVSSGHELAAHLYGAS